MAVTQNTYTGNGSTTNYSITFEYLEETDIKVTLNGTLTTAYTLANATTISFTTAPANGVAIRIYRDTDTDDLQSTFFAGSAIRAQDLNSNFLQSNYSVQEIKDRFLDRTGGTMSGNLAMGGYKVTGLGAPTASADAVTKSYVDGYINTTYLGPSATDPTTRPGGSPLQVGDQYFNTNQNILKAWTGTVWVISAAAGSIIRWRKTASAGNTTLSGVDDLGITLSYVVGNEQVFLNGALQTRGVDYTAATGTSITFTPALLAGDVVELHAVQGYVSATVPDGSVGENKLAAGAVTETKLAAGAVTETKLATGAVTETKLATGAVTSAKIADGTIVDVDVNSAAGIVASKLSFTQAGAGATARTVDSRLKDVVSVKDFGAVGNGVADDTAAINLALAASTSVFFPAGTYLTSGGHNIREKSLFGGSKLNTIIKLSGTNTNSSLFINGDSISTPWGSGGGCQLRDLTLRGNWDGSTTNSTTSISSIGALLKWWSGTYVQIERCTFQNSFGFGIFSYRLGYSYINTSFVSTNAKNGIHLEAPSGAEGITSTTINDCSVNSCRGRSVSAATGGSGIYIKNGFYCNVNGCTIEDIDDGIRIDGNDNRSITIFETHIETVFVSCVNYAGAGQSLMLFQNIFATSPAFVQASPAFNLYTSIGNFGLDTVFTLPVLSTGSTQVSINNATPRATMASVTLTPGTWVLTGAWNGSVVSGLGQVSTDQAYAINTSAAIPGYSSSFNVAVFAGDKVSPTNAFNVLQGSLSLQVTVTVNTTYYLYGGPSSITSSLSAVLAGHLKAVKVNGPYF